MGLHANLYYYVLLKNIDENKKLISKKDYDCAKNIADILTICGDNQSINNVLNEHCIINRDENNNPCFVGFINTERVIYRVNNLMKNHLKEDIIVKTE